MDISVDTHAMTELADFWKRAPAIVRAEMKRAVTDIDLLIQGEIQQDLPRGAGGLHGAGLVGAVHTEEHVMADNVIGMVATSQPYAEYVETGTKPHAPPIQPLEDWVRAKLGLAGKEATSAAFAIRKTIADEGTQAQPVWQDTYKRVLPKIQIKLREALARIKYRLAGNEP
jgi:hypothetical protein